MEKPKNEEDAPKVIIDEARIDDAEGMQRVWKEAWLATYPNEEYGITREDVEYKFRPERAVERLEKLSGILSSANPNSMHIVARVDGEIIGLCGVQKTDEHNRLKTIYVAPEHQRLGVGMLLWEKAQDFFDATKDTVVWVTEYNDNAINFYKKLGFEDTGVRVKDDERFRMRSGSYMPAMKMILQPQAQEECQQ